MDKSFAHLLRNSRLASYDPVLPQIYRTASAHHKTGDWGLKRNLPTVISSHVIKIGALDTPEHQTPFDSALHDVTITQQWLENFPHSLPPVKKPEKLARNIRTMPDWKWKLFLLETHRRKNEWREKIKNSKASKSSYLAFLNATSGKDDDL